MARTITLVFNLNDAAISGAKSAALVTSTNSFALAKVAQNARKEIRQAIGPDIRDEDVSITSVTVA